MTTAILWFRRDLRLTDNPALTHALQTAERIVPVYVHAPEEEQPWQPGAASRWWLHHSLAALDASLRRLGSGLLIRRGPSLETLTALIHETGAAQVYWNRLYEPARIARDSAIKQALREQGLTAASFNSALLHEPWAIQRGGGGPYRVFTPYWKAVQRLGHQGGVLPAPAALPAPPDLLGLSLDELRLLPKIAWDCGMRQTWQPGEAAALVRLEAFCAGAMADYAEGRDRPAEPGTSRLSPYLHFGEIGPRQIFQAVAALPSSPGGDSFLRELAWREFAHHLLFHFPHTPDRPLDARFERFAWNPAEAGLLQAWQQGQTGLPWVDAGMRELWQTGWMHNRVRMAAASWLVKNLRIHWLEGARWFWDTLVDADLANNTLGWQWVAGCGADAAPYFRIFNPVLQGQRFDPQGEYICRWLPELARLPPRFIHQPWEAPAEVLAAAGLRLGRDYPRPSVDLKTSREQALAAFKQLG